MKEYKIVVFSKQSEKIEVQARDILTLDTCHFRQIFKFKEDFNS